MPAYCTDIYDKQVYDDHDLIPVTLHLIKIERSMTSEYILDVKDRIKKKVERINELHVMMKRRPEDDEEVDNEDMTMASAEQIAKKRKQ